MALIGLYFPGSSTHPQPLRSQEIDVGNAFAKTRLTAEVCSSKTSKRNQTNDWLTKQETLLRDGAVWISPVPYYSLYLLDVV
jgi:hypothetical protein